MKLSVEERIVGKTAECCSPTPLKINPSIFGINTSLLLLTLENFETGKFT